MFPNLRAEMARLGLTVKDVADKIGVEKTWLENRLNGKCVMPAKAVYDIATKCFPNVQFDYLFADTAIVPFTKALQKTVNDNEENE